MILYGISNCDTIKKAKKWLTDQSIDFQFHDFRKDGLEAALLQEWIDASGWEPLLNKRGTTWRKIAAEVDRNNLDAALAAELMLEHPALIKRPVLVVENRIIENGVTENKIIIGFKQEEYSQLCD
jgi:arsenate reductase